MTADTLAQWPPVILAGYVLWQTSITRNTGGTMSLFVTKLIPAALAVGAILASAIAGL